MPQAEEEEVSYLQRSHHILQLFPHKMQISASGWFENPHLKNKKEIKPRNQQVLALSFMFFYYIFSFPSPFSFFFLLVLLEKKKLRQRFVSFSVFAANKSFKSGHKNLPLSQFCSAQIITSKATEQSKS